MDKKRVKTILSQNNIDDKDLVRIDYHMNILSSNAENLIKKLTSEGIISDVEEMSELEIAKLLANLIKKCDISSENYDRKLDEEMTKFGLRLEEKASRAKTHRK